MGSEGTTRRDFVATAGGAAVATLLPGRAGAASRRRRYAMVGTGVRGIGMWGRPLVERYADVLEFVGLCDVNPLRVEVARKSIGVDCPTFTSLDEMLDRAKPELLMVTTVDSTHEACIVKALERGADVLTEKPMVIDEAQCRSVLEAEKRSGRSLGVTFNYRFAPKHRKIKELLLAGEIGRVTSVDFSWYLDTSHGADYFRRWHRLRSKSGSLWVQVEPPLRLVNWWLDADRRGLGVREPAAVREAGRVPPHELPPVPGQGEVRVPLGHHEEPPAGVPVRGVREGRRLPA
jgi:predicted dehydrogenase